MTKDLALLVGPDQSWLSTTGFLDKVDENLNESRWRKPPSAISPDCRYLAGPRQSAARLF